MKQSAKVIGIIILFTFICSTIIFNGSIDDFAPKHMASISEISHKGQLPEYSQSPAFYAFGSVIQNIANLSGVDLLYFPIQFFAFFFVFLIFISKILDSYMVASVIVFIEMISGSLGTTKIFFWPHGLGSILFYLSLYFLLNILKSNKSNKSEYLLLFVVSGSSLVFISYNLYAMLAILLLLTFFLFNFLKRYVVFTFDQFENVRLNNTMLNLILVLIVVQFGLSNFLYKTFIPTLNIIKSVEINGIDKFLKAYFSIGVGDEPITTMLLEFPNMITIISGIKYSVLMISIALFFYLSFKKIVSKKNLNEIDLFVLSLVFMSVVYSFIRLYIGGIVVSLFYFPGVICSLWIFRYQKSYQKWSIFVILLLLILTPLYSYTLSSNDLTNKDISKFDYFDAPSDWYFEHHNGYLAVSDEMTKNFIILNIYESSKNSHNISIQELSQQFKILLVDDATSLIKLTSKSDLNKYYFINYNLNRMSLQNWIIIKSWRNYRNQIENNCLVNNIYDSGLICIYI